MGGATETLVAHHNKNLLLTSNHKIKRKVHMTRRTKVAVVCVVGTLLLLLSQMTIAAPQVLLKLYANDGTRSGMGDSLILGLDPLATNHIDSTLGEEEFPPGGPPFTVYFATNPGPVGKDTCGTGTKVNYHFMLRETQTDRWRVGFWSDDSGGNVSFAWSIIIPGGNGWTIEDGSPDEITTLPHFSPIDMLTQSSFTYPVKTTQAIGPQYIYINYFDGLKLTSASLDSLTADAAKKLVKRKNYRTQFELQVGAHLPAGPYDGLHVEFGDVIYYGGPTSASWGTVTSGDAGKGKVWNFSSPSGPIALPMDIQGIGGKGKPVTIKKWYWLNGTTNAEGKLTFKTEVTSVNQVFLLPIPNWQNVGDELYKQGLASAETENGKNVGIRIGVRDQVGTDSKDKPIFRWIIHPKWGDVAKSLWKKGVGGQIATPSCIFQTVDTKPIVKEIKGGLNPGKFNDILYGEAIALKFNINASDHYAKMEHSGFGTLTYNKPGTPFDGYTIDAFADTLDHFMSWCSYSGVGTAADFEAAAHDFNTAFSGPFDTVTFGAGGKIVVKGVRAVGTVPYLFRASAQVPPTTPVLPYRDDQNPVSYKLEQNYPNPFNPTTTIEFNLSQDAFVTLTVYNILGQEVMTLLNHEQVTGGDNEVSFDGSRLASGVYYYRLTVNDGEFQQVKKMMLLK